MSLIQDVQTDEWWQDVTIPMLERVRKRLRALVKLIDKQKRKPIYTDFEDEMGGETGSNCPASPYPAISRSFAPRPAPSSVSTRIM